jgi:hypothetical protein
MMSFRVKDWSVSRSFMNLGLMFSSSTASQAYTLPDVRIATMCVLSVNTCTMPPCWSHLFRHVTQPSLTAQECIHQQPDAAWETALFHPKTSIFLQNRPSYSGSLNPEMPGSSKNASLHWGDVLGNVKGGFSCSSMRNVSCFTVCKSKSVAAVRIIDETYEL